MKTFTIKGAVLAAMLATAGLAAQAADKVVVQMKWVPQAQFAGYYVAAAKGYYKDAGLDVTIKPGGPGVPSLQMVATGQADAGITGADELLLARERGADVVEAELDDVAPGHCSAGVSVSAAATLPVFTTAVAASVPSRARSRASSSAPSSCQGPRAQCRHRAPGGA